MLGSISAKRKLEKPSARDRKSESCNRRLSRKQSAYRERQKSSNNKCSESKLSKQRRMRRINSNKERMGLKSILPLISLKATARQRRKESSILHLSLGSQATSTPFRRFQHFVLHLRNSSSKSQRETSSLRRTLMRITAAGTSRTLTTSTRWSGLHGKISALSWTCSSYRSHLQTQSRRTTPSPNASTFTFD